MERTVERRRTVTRTIRHAGADEMRNNIREVAREIGRVRDQAMQEADALEKIRGMLDTGYLADLMTSVAELESRMTEMETEALHASEDAGRARRELEEEQERLQKLWDAYKIQEDELERLKRDYPLMEEKLFERDRQLEGVRREIARLEQFARYKEEYEATASENERLAHALDQAEAELERAASGLRSAEDELHSLRAIEADSHRVKDLERELEEERERLAKLYRVYEDQEHAKADLQARLDHWERWFSKSRSAFEATGHAPETAPR
jgi:chromosome segregation ATPase